MALIKSTDCIYVFDCRAGNACGMPDSNGTAVMKLVTICHLEQYLYSLT